MHQCAGIHTVLLILFLSRNTTNINMSQIFLHSFIHIEESKNESQNYLSLVQILHLNSEKSFFLLWNLTQSCNTNHELMEH